MITLAAATVSLMLQPAAQPAQAPDEPVAAGEEAQVDVAAKKGEDKVVCKRQTIVGSKFKRRLCFAESEWEALRRKAIEDTADLQRRGKGLSPNG